MPTKRSISFLKSKLLQPALTSHFEVNIPSGSLPSDIKIDREEQEDLNLFCTEASLPGSSVNTFEVKNDFTGATETFAHRKMYDNFIDFTFYVDAQKYSAIRFFERWMRYVTGEEGSDRTDGELRSYKNPSYNYRIRYPDGDGGYRCDGLTISKFERSHKSQIRYTFLKSFPTAVSSMPVSYEASNLLKCTVTMSYVRYFIDESLVKDPSTAFPQVTPRLVGGTSGEDQRFIPTDSATGDRGLLLQPLRDAAGNIVSDLQGNRI